MARGWFILVTLDCCDDKQDSNESREPGVLSTIPPSTNDQPKQEDYEILNWENQDIWNDVLMLCPLVTTAAVLMLPWQDANVPHPSFYDENKSLFRQCISKLYIKVRLEPGVCSALCISPVFGCEQKQIRHVSELIFKCLTNYFSAWARHNPTFRHFSLLSNCHLKPGLIGLVPAGGWSPQLAPTAASPLYLDFTNINHEPWANPPPISSPSS